MNRDFFHRCPIVQAQCLHVFFKVLPPQLNALLTALLPFLEHMMQTILCQVIENLLTFFSEFLARSQIECPRALSLVMGIRRSNREEDWGCKAVVLNLARNCEVIRHVRLCVVMMKSPSSPMKLWPFLCNVLLQFSQH